MDKESLKEMISLCITTYNRTDLLFESFKGILSDDRVNEIVIVDDASGEDVFRKLKTWLPNNINSNVKLYQNAFNLDCYRNKREAISKASNEWVIILDSDNIITPAYLDAIFDISQDWIAPNKVLYQPSFAKPNFNFTAYEGLLINQYNVGKYMHDGTFQTMLNAMNYFVNRDEYLKVWDGSVDPVTSDSIFHNYNWLKAGNSIYVVPGLEYEHRVHSGSHYQNNVRRTPRGFHEEIVNKLKALS